MIGQIIVTDDNDKRLLKFTMENDGHWTGEPTGALLDYIDAAFHYDWEVSSPADGTPGYRKIREAEKYLSLLGHTQVTLPPVDHTPNRVF